MKKAISIFLAVALCLGMCSMFSGCSSNDIKLTLDNYEQYLKVSASAFYEKDYKGNLFVIGRSGAYDYATENYGENIYGSVSVKGLSQNFNYSNVKIEVEITGKYNHCDLTAAKGANENTLLWSTFSFVATCEKVDITGTGNNSRNDKFALPTGRGIPVLSYANGVTQFYKLSDFLQYTYKVVSVSGTITPV